MRIRLLVACLAACGTLGCWVLDELDSSARTLKATPAKTEPASEAPPSRSEPSGPSWWARALTLGSEELDDEIVRCDLGRTTVEFMPRPDCLTRGGTPAEPRG